MVWPKFICMRKEKAFKAGLKSSGENYKSNSLNFLLFTENCPRHFALADLADSQSMTSVSKAIRDLKQKDFKIISSV